MYSGNYKIKYYIVWVPKWFPRICKSDELTSSSLNDIGNKNVCHGGPDFQVR